MKKYRLYLIGNVSAKTVSIIISVFAINKRSVLFCLFVVVFDCVFVCVCLCVQVYKCVRALF